MEGGQGRREERPKRCYQCNRLEDQLWELAYQRLWPAVRRALKSKLDDAKNRQPVRRLTMVKGA